MNRKMLVGLAALALAAPVWGAELITNGTFDTDLSGWQAGRASWGEQSGLNLISRTSTGGAHAPGVSPAGGNSAGMDNGGEFNGSRWIAQEVTGLTIGETYTLSGYIAGGAGGAQPLNGNSTAWWQLGYIPGPYDANAVDLGTNATNVVNQTVDGASGASVPWTFGSGNFVATDTTYTIYYKYGAANVNWNYYAAYVDGVSLVPEPATLALLALGLPMLRRRKVNA